MKQSNYERYTKHSDPVLRPVGLETEYGILQLGNVYANPIVMSSNLVSAYGNISRPKLSEDKKYLPPVRWDYESEDPLADLRGGRLERACAHPSQLTDAPAQLSLSDEVSKPVWREYVRASAQESALLRATSVVLTNGARLYVDHAHPEYSSPEVLSPREALIWDRAGEAILQKAMCSLNQVQENDAAKQVVLYKNNVDGKGAAYGTHENYLLDRNVPFPELVSALTPFLITRQIFAGAGRVGIGQYSQQPGFQLSQRADYIETEVGLQTTFNRPLVNTRDEPHADMHRFRRLHVITGDANRFDTPNYLKIATTNLLLWFLERAHKRGEALTELAQLRIVDDPVSACWAISHDTALTYAVSTISGQLTALAIQRRIFDIIKCALEADNVATAAETDFALHLWNEVLDELEFYANSLGTAEAKTATALAAKDVEWIAKKQLCETFRARTSADWADPRVAALDIQWADLRAGKGLAEKVMQATAVRTLVADSEVTAAVTTPPVGTRAYVRGMAIAEIPQVVSASWTSLGVDLSAQKMLKRLTLPSAVACSVQQGEILLNALRSCSNVQ